MKKSAKNWFSALMLAMACTAPPAFGQTSLSSSLFSASQRLLEERLEAANRGAAPLGDSAFDVYVSPQLIHRAYATVDPALLADVALQLAEGERVLLRSRSGITAKQALNLAIRAATDRQDKAALERLSRHAARQGDQELSAQIAGAQKLTAVSRVDTPRLVVPIDELDIEDFGCIRYCLQRIDQAKLTGDSRCLAALEEDIKTCVSPAAQPALVRMIANTRSSMAKRDDASEQLDVWMSRLTPMYDAGSPDRHGMLVSPSRGWLDNIVRTPPPIRRPSRPSPEPIVPVPETVPGVVHIYIPPGDGTSSGGTIENTESESEPDVGKIAEAIWKATNPPNPFPFRSSTNSRQLPNYQNLLRQRLNSPSRVIEKSTTATDDAAFDVHVASSLIARAYESVDPALLADVALQLAEGERVLLRSRSGITAKQALNLAIRAATDRQDKAALERLSRHAARQGDQELSAQIAGAQKLTAVSRVDTPRLVVPIDELDIEDFGCIRYCLQRIDQAKLTGDSRCLAALEEDIKTSVPAAQRDYLRKMIADARAAIPTNEEVDESLVQFLHRLTATSRPDDDETSDQPAMVSGAF